MKKILFIDHDEYVTGSTVSLKYLIECLQKNGKFEVFILTPKKDKQLKYFTDAGCKCISSYIFRKSPFVLNLHFSNIISPLTIRGFLLIFTNLAKLVLGIYVAANAITNVRPDVVYVNEYVALQGSIAAKFFKIPSVIHIRSQFITGIFGLRRFILSKLILFFNSYVFAISPIEAGQLNAPSSEKIKIIGEFLNKSDFKRENNITDIKKAFGFPLFKPLIVMLGGINYVKGTSDFLKAAKIIIKEHREVIFIIAGKNNKLDREYYDRCRCLVKELGASIYILGEISNATDLIYCSDVIVSANICSHFSRPVIEAWALKKPVIATRTKHSLALIEDQIDGIIVNCLDPVNMADGIVTVLNDYNLAHSLGENGFHKVLRQFNIDKNTSLICGSLCSLLK